MVYFNIVPHAGRNLLSTLADKGPKSEVEKLLSNNANVNSTDWNGRTPSLTLQNIDNSIYRNFYWNAVPSLTLAISRDGLLSPSLRSPIAGQALKNGRR
jgi:hypothetical protein